MLQCSGRRFRYNCIFLHDLKKPEIRNIIISEMQFSLFFVGHVIKSTLS
jgi:hypothetical protein